MLCRLTVGVSQACDDATAVRVGGLVVFLVTYVALTLTL